MERAEGSESSQPATVKVVVDGREIEVSPGTLVIEAIERAGTFVPRFCYHPRMRPVGMCRVCLVEVSGPRGFSLQPSCFVRVEDGMEVRATSEAARKAQEGVLEFLLINHPLDCPVCDKGGECPLQDQAFSYGPGESRFVEEKRHFAKPIPLSPLVDLDRERCIQCGRCTRFAYEVAGEPEIDFAGRGERLEVAIAPGHEFRSIFAGNTVQICPVGALTARPYRFKARPWDLDQAETSCVFCSLGCRSVVQVSDNRVIRLLGVDVDSLNQSWMCDRGRFAYEALEAQTRLLEPMARKDSAAEPVPCGWWEGLERLAEMVVEAQAREGPGSIHVIAGKYLTLEEYYLLVRVFKGLVGTDNVDILERFGLDPALLASQPQPSLDEVLGAEATLVLGADLRESVPVIYLRLRQQAHFGHPTFEASPYRTPLADACRGRFSLHPAGEDGLADWVEQALGSFQSVGVIAVPFPQPSLAPAFEQAIRTVREALSGRARVLLAASAGNLFGAIEAGAAPGLLPGRAGLDRGGRFVELWGKVPEHPGRGAEALFADPAGASLVVFWGVDPERSWPYPYEVERLMASGAKLAYVGTHLPRTPSTYEVMLAARGFAEKEGFFVNLERRAFPLSRKSTGPLEAWSDLEILSTLAELMGEPLEVSDAHQVLARACSEVPAWGKHASELLDASRARDGVYLAGETKAVVIRRMAPDPIATPGVASVERQGFLLYSFDEEPVTQLATYALADEGQVATGGEGGETPQEEPPSRGPVESTTAGGPVRGQAEAAGSIPAGDVPAPEAPVGRPSGSPEGSVSKEAGNRLKVILRKRVYDRGTFTEEAGHLRVMASQMPEVRVHPRSVDGLGADEGPDGSGRSHQVARLAVLKDASTKPGQGGVLMAQLVLDESLPPGLAVLDHRIGEPVSNAALGEDETIEIVEIVEVEARN
jgi:NADH-quinone oxidoreductase subunit G